MDPAELPDLDQVKIALVNQGAAIGRHEQALQQILTQLQSLTATLQQAAPPVVVPAAPPAPAPQVAEEAAARSEPHLPPPERYSGDPGGCRGFLLQCSLAFEQQPSRFPSERAKVAYIISLLSGRALAWATPVWENRTDVCASSEQFIAALRRTFHHPVSGGEASSRLLRIRQGRRPLADYSIEFRTLAAESGWNSEALMAAFQQGLSEELKDELAPRDSPSTLDDLIELALRLDNRLRERRRARESGGAPSACRLLPSSVANSAPAEHSEEAQPMQLGHTRLSRHEREARMREGRCLYCGQAGHLRPACPELTGNGQVRHGQGGP